MKKSKLTELLEALYVKHGDKNKNSLALYSEEIAQIVKEEIARVSKILKLKEDEQLDQAFNDAKPVTEEKVYIDYLNKKKGFKQDRIKFKSYEDAVKWAKKNFEKFNPDMIKYESVVTEAVDKDDLKNAKFRLKKVLKYLDIEYKTTRRGEKYVQINYIPVTRPQSQNPEFVNVSYEDETDLQNIGKALKLKLKESVSEVAERDYKKEYEKYGKSEKAKKYRAELNKYNRDKGTYGNGDNKDASHKGGKIVGFESESKNRGRAEKSRLKKSK